MPIQKEVLAGAIGVGAATFGCYYVYKQITRHYSLVESGGTKNDASGSADFFESTEIIEQRTCNRSEGQLSDRHSVNPGSEPEQGTSCGTSGGDNCINSNASQSKEPASHGDVISPQTVLKKTNDLGDNHVSSHHASLQDNHLTNSSNSRQLLDNSKLDSCLADQSPQKYACLNLEESVMPNNDKDMGKEYEFDGQKSDITEVKDVQEEINANQNQPDLTIDNEAHGHHGLERSISEILNVYDYSPTTTTPTDGSQYTHHRSRDSTSSLNSQTSIETDAAPLGPQGRMSVRGIVNGLHDTIQDSNHGEPFSQVNSIRYSEFSALNIREEETSMCTNRDSFMSSSQVLIEHNISQKSAQKQNTHSVSPVHDIIQLQLVEDDDHASQPENQTTSQPIQPCILSTNGPEPSPQLPTISTRTSLPPAGTTTCLSDLSIKNTNQNNVNVQNPISRTNGNNLDPEQGQSDNDQTVAESVLTNERTESTSEYGTMTSNSDNLSHSLDDQSNTDNVNVTPEVQEVIGSISDINPECKTSLPMADAEPTTGTDKSVTDLMDTASAVNDEKAITDAVILHAEDDRELVLELIQNMETEFPKLKLNLKLFEELNAGKTILGSAPLLFGTCRFLFVFVTKAFAKDDLPRFLNEILLIETITFKDKSSRLIPVLKDECYLPELAPLIPLKYNRYLEGKSRGIRDRGFMNSFEKLVKIGRKNYLPS
ncbi:hybrid signal transduction histidine kinase M-like [Mytilus trossulus]|uniref:hybrid signal transduction histidine kinase M-like n=1 Tax=Mytilus trossulus TaxID=6551 RepID=UPI003006D576